MKSKNGEEKTREKETKQHEEQMIEEINMFV